MRISITEVSRPTFALIFPKNIINKFPSRVKRGMREILINTKKEAISSTMRNDKTGRLYVISKKTRGGSFKNYLHRASAPGQSHAKISGKLGRSIKYDFQSNLIARYGYDTSTDYGIKLENSTQLVKARPTLKNSINNMRVANRQIINNVMRPIYFS